MFLIYCKKNCKKAFDEYSKRRGEGVPDDGKWRPKHVGVTSTNRVEAYIFCV